MGWAEEGRRRREQCLLGEREGEREGEIRQEECWLAERQGNERRRRMACSLGERVEGRRSL